MKQNQKIALRLKAHHVMMQYHINTGGLCRELASQVALENVHGVSLQRLNIMIDKFSPAPSN